MSAIVYLQHSYMDQKEIGYNKDLIVTLPIGNSKMLAKSHAALRKDLEDLPEVVSVSIGTDALGSGYTNNSGYVAREGQSNVNKEGVLTTYFMIDKNFIDTYQLEMAYGEQFKGIASDSNSIINETLANKLGLDDAIGAHIKIWGPNDPSQTVIGVLKDFNFQSLHKPVGSVVLTMVENN